MATKAATPPPEDAAPPVVKIERIDEEVILVPIVGTSPLIVHNWSDKARRQMLDNMQNRRSPKQPKDPQAEYEAAFYRTVDGYGFPASGFKAATVGAARFYGKDVKMTELRQFIFIKGVFSDADRQALVPIVGEAKMREDVVRVARGGTDLRYRPEFPEWSATLHVAFVKSCLDRNSVLSLIDAGGLGVGIGEWRPEKKGDFGTFQIDETKEIEVVRR
jgi:hypothetical protein